jgi:pyruvate ferredoxin oxidoreductase alpha subunit
VRAALYDLPERPVVLDFVVGLGGRDIRLEDLENAARKTYEAVERRLEEKTDWVQVRL